VRARHVAVAAAAVIALTGCGSSSEDKPAEPAAQTSGAQQVVDAIAEKWPLPNPRDTTSGCKAKEGDTGKGCESRITTDAVTVIEYADDATAAAAAKTLAKVGDARQAGRYVLMWTDDQDLTSEDARTDMVRIAKSL